MDYELLVREDKTAIKKNFFSQYEDEYSFMGK